MNTTVAQPATAAAEASATDAHAQGVPLDKAGLHGDEKIQAPIGTIELQDSYFDDDLSRRLFDEMDYQRASQ